MFGDTMVLTIDGSPVTLVKINQDGYSSEYLYKDTTESIRARIRHTVTRNGANRQVRDRHNVEVVVTTFATETTAEQVEKAYFVMENIPSRSAAPLMEALAAWADATNLAKLETWQS